MKPTLPGRIGMLVYMAMGSLSVWAEGAAEAVMKQNGEDIVVVAPAEPVPEEDVEETQASAPHTGPSVNKAELRALATQRIEMLGRVVQAYNSMPEKLRQEAHVQNVSGAFRLLRTHADRYPELALNDDLRDTMEWALVFLTTGKLQGSPALQKLVQVIDAETAIEDAQLTAKHLATTFKAAKSAGTRDFDKVETLEDITHLLNEGVKGTGTYKNQLFVSKSTPELAAEAALHLKFDAADKTLRYNPKSVKLEGSAVPLEGIEELALLMKQMPGNSPASPVADDTSQTPEAKVQQAALALCNVFNAAMATGMTELDDVKTVDEIILRFKQGVQSGSQTHFLRSTLEQAQAARLYVQLDLKKKLLLLSPAGINSVVSGPMERQASPSLNYPGSPAEAERKACALATAFGSATATGSKELDDVKTIDDIIQRLNVGVHGDGDFAKRRFYVRTTPSQAAAAKAFLKFDGDKKLLSYQPGSMDANFHYPKSPEAQTPSLASEISDAQAQRTAQALASIYNAAVATGSKDVYRLQSLNAVIDRLTTTGLTGGPGPFEGRRFYTKITPGEAEAAKPYLRYDPFSKTLSYSTSGIRSRSPAVNQTRASMMDVGREIRMGHLSSKQLAELQAAAIKAHHARMAQAFVSTYNSAMAAGSRELEHVGTVDHALRRIMSGVNGVGPFKCVRFAVMATPEDAATAKRYISFDSRHRILVYHSPYR
ncbi:MAG: hypothetical protein U1F81_04230 [Verrucomicrobiaceae bacterium]